VLFDAGDLAKSFSGELSFAALVARSTISAILGD
jgi:hypothetical protein